ncbi:MAG: ParB N-terminal domain-containing protein, partial [Bryobacteraceae bacterium]
MRLTEIAISEILPNAENPRGIDIPTQDTKLSYLKDSIKTFGVLVPVVLTPRGNKFLLVDGERRYYAAKAVGLDKLPAYIITANNGSELASKDLLFRMFQIHHLRDQWGPVQQCRALESTYDKIVVRKEIKAIEDVKSSVKAVTEELADVTGIDYRTAWDRVKFLRWPKDIKLPLYQHPDAEGYWYICEIEEKIIIPALSNYPEYFEKVPVDEVRKDLFKKLNTVLERSTDVRKIGPFFKAELRRAADRKSLCRILDKLRSQPEMTYQEAQEELISALPEITKRDPPSPRRLVSAMSSLELDLGIFDVSFIRPKQGRGHATVKELLVAAKSLKSGL